MSHPDTTSRPVAKEPLGLRPTNEMARGEQRRIGTLDIHYKNGRTVSFVEVGHCVPFGNILLGYSVDNRLLFRGVLTEIDFLEIRDS
jgi:hypothetical protein